MAEWTCIRCGSSAVASERFLLDTMGWRFADGATSSDGHCPICARKYPLRGEPGGDAPGGDEPQTS